ncbi:MAG: glycosyltransferase [Candidatus Latescibacterota bacterium]|nr:MAG: glycosyltransferase [Candidatus Latescibacterota bacterium]
MKNSPRKGDRGDRLGRTQGLDPMGNCGTIHNILIVENELRMGGLEKKLYDLAARIDRNHFRIAMCCLKRGGYWKDAFVELGVPFYEGFLKHKYDVLAYPRLLRLLAKENIDLIYTLPHPNSILLSAMAKATGRVNRVVVSIHGTGSPHGGKMVRGYLKPVLGNIDRFIAVAREHKRYLVEVEDLDPERVDVIYNGVDLDKYHPGEPKPGLAAELGVRDDRRLVTTVASMDLYKGIDVLLHAASPICGQFDDVDFVIVGGGPDRDKIVPIAAKLGIADRVTFTGVRADVDDILRLSDFFVLPSRTEAFPNVILEAMASGVPVISTDVGSVSEMIDNEENGLLVPADDAGQLAGAIRRLLREPETSRAFADAGRRTVEDKFPIQRMCTERERLFSELLCGH